MALYGQPAESTRPFWLVQFYWVFWLAVSFVVSFAVGYILTGWPVQ